MEFVFLAVLCSALISVILKINEIRSGNRIVVLTWNYITASLVSGYMWLNKSPGFVHEPSLILFGFLIGLLFIFTFYSYMFSVKSFGVAISTLFARLSIAIPLTGSVVFYSETPTIIRIVGILLTVLGFITFSLSFQEEKGKNRESKEYYWIGTLFAGLGIADFSMKIFSEHYSSVETGFFLLLIFGTATITGLVIILYNAIRPSVIDIGMGILLGIPNIFASFFLIKALNNIPALIVYPLVNVSIIMITLLAGVVLFKEKMNLWRWITIIIATIAILFMSFPE